MPGTTPSGLPYPLPSEPVRDGAVAIRNLAEKTERRARWDLDVGHFNVTSGPDSHFGIACIGIPRGWAISYLGEFAIAVIPHYTGGTTLMCTLRNMITGDPLPNALVTISSVIYSDPL